MNSRYFSSSQDGDRSATRMPIPNRFTFMRLLAGHRRVSLRWFIALCATAIGAFQAWGQTVNIGTATFTSASDQISADWYWPMPSGVVYIYDGYGTFRGMTRSETYTIGQRVVGVKTVKWHTETTTGGSSATTMEDWWLALDSTGNLRVIQIVQSGRAEFVASGGGTPPMFLPNSPAEGQSWEFLGNKLTIENVIASGNAGGGLKLGIAVPGSPIEYYTYNAGVGLVHDAASAKPAPIGSGWTLRVR